MDLAFLPPDDDVPRSLSRDGTPNQSARAGRAGPGAPERDPVAERRGSAAVVSDGRCHEHVFEHTLNSHSPVTHTKPGEH
jgi:hypothetical protein